MALAGPLQAFMFAVMVRTRQSQLTYVDARVRLLSETITSIRAVKLFAYVSFFSSKVTELRKKELVFLKKNGFNRASMNATMAFIPTLAAVCTLFPLYDFFIPQSGAHTFFLLISNVYHIRTHRSFSHTSDYILRPAVLQRPQNAHCLLAYVLYRDLRRSRGYREDRYAAESRGDARRGQCTGRC